MTRIAHLTDLHFGAEDPEIVDALVQELNAYRPDLVAISGDLTQGGRRSEFRAARAFIDRLDAPTLAVPGNHDITPYNLLERFTDPYARWRTTISPETEPCWRDASIAAFGLNTARRFGFNWDWSRGRITRVRLARLVRRLDAAPAELSRVVVAHHPLLPPEQAPRTTLAGGAVVALAALALHDVVLVLAGHLHRGYARRSGSGNRRPLILQGGTATSVRLRGEPNSYNRVTVSGPGDLAIETRVWRQGRWASDATPESDATSLPLLEKPLADREIPVFATTKVNGTDRDNIAKTGPAHIT